MNRKTLSICIIILFLFILTGCKTNGNDKITLDSPENVYVDDNLIKWSFVDGANEYIISINETEYKTSNNYYDLSFLTYGTYKIKVKALGDGITTKSSKYTNYITYVSQKSQNNNQNNNPNNNPNHDDLLLKKTRYVVKANNILSTPLLKYSYNEEYYNVFVYYLGTIESVPIASGIPELYDGLSDRTISLSISNLSTDAVETSKSSCYSEANVRTSGWSGESGISVTVGTGQNASFKAEGTISYAHTRVREEENSTSTSFTDAYSALQSKSTEFTQTTTYTINSNYESNCYYRISVISDCDIYAFMVYDSKAKNISIQYDISPIENTMFRCIESSKTNNFKSTQDIEKEIIFNPNEAIDDGLLNYTYTPQSKDLGTLTDPYIISSATDFFNKIKYDSEGVYFMLTNDVDFSGHTYTPLSELKGIIIGNGYTIKNCYVTLVDSEQSGFFKTITSTGQIRDVRFLNIIFNKVTYTGNSNNVFAGIVCGINYGKITNTLVENCHLYDVCIGEILVDDSHRAYAGLICGQSEAGSVLTKCGAINSTVNVSSRTGYGVADSYAAGIVGRSGTNITYCYSFNNTISAYTKGSKGLFKGGSVFSYAGGIVGRLFPGNILDYCISYNVSISAKAEEGKNCTDIKNQICPENNGTIGKICESTSIPTNFDNELWTYYNGLPSIIYEWKHLQ